MIKEKLKQHKRLGIKDSCKMFAVPENDNILHNIITVKATIGFFLSRFSLLFSISGRPKTRLNVLELHNERKTIYRGAVRLRIKTVAFQHKLSQL